jgi:single-strand DNA-binding protein
MSQFGIVTLTGYVAAEPKLWHTKQTKTPVTHVRIGSTPRRMDRDTGEWQDGQTSYFTVNCWRKLALNVRASLHKGDPVIVRGKLRTRVWLEEGRPRTEVEIDADSVGHDLNAGWANFLREGRPRLPEEEAADAAEAAADGTGASDDIRQFPDPEDGLSSPPEQMPATDDVFTEAAIAELDSDPDKDTEPAAVGR